MDNLHQLHPRLTWSEPNGLIATFRADGSSSHRRHVLGRFQKKVRARRCLLRSPQKETRTLAGEAGSAISEATGQVEPNP